MDRVRRLARVGPAFARVRIKDASLEIEASPAMHFQNYRGVPAQGLIQSCRLAGTGIRKSELIAAAPDIIFIPAELTDKRKSFTSPVLQGAPVYRGNIFGQDQRREQDQPQNRNSVVHPALSQFIPAAPAFPLFRGPAPKPGPIFIAHKEKPAGGIGEGCRVSGIDKEVPEGPKRAQPDYQ